MATSPIYGDPLPNAGSTDQVPADLLTYVTAAEKRFVGKFATAAARDVKITAPTGGMMCWLDTPGCYSEYLGAAWKNRYSTGVQFWKMNWPASSLPGTNNLSTPTQTVTPNIGPYLMRVSINCLFTAGGTGAAPSVQMVINGAQASVALTPLISSANTTYTASLSRDFYISDGATQTVVGRLQIPAGVTCTTYADDAASYVTISVQPV